MEIRHSFIPVHREGYFITLKCERTTEILKAIRMGNEEDLSRWMHGMYGPDDPENFEIKRIKATYELEETENERTERSA